MRDTVVKQQIDSIMDSFDFRKVHDVMTYLGWKWASAENGVPSEYELRQLARKLMEDCVNNRGGVGTGGLYVEYTEGVEDGNPWLRINLSFRLVQSFNDGEFY